MEETQWKRHSHTHQQQPTNARTRREKRGLIPPYVFSFSPIMNNERDGGEERREESEEEEETEPELPAVHTGGKDDEKKGRKKEEEKELMNATHPHALQLARLRSPSSFHYSVLF